MLRNLRLLALAGRREQLDASIVGHRAVPQRGRAAARGLRGCALRGLWRGKGIPCGRVGAELGSRVLERDGSALRASRAGLQPSVSRVRNGCSLSCTQGPRGSAHTMGSRSRAQPARIRLLEATPRSAIAQGAFTRHPSPIASCHACCRHTGFTARSGCPGSSPAVKSIAKNRPSLLPACCPCSRPLFVATAASPRPVGPAAGCPQMMAALGSGGTRMNRRWWSRRSSGRRQRRHPIAAAWPPARLLGPPHASLAPKLRAVASRTDSHQPAAPPHCRRTVLRLSQNPNSEHLGTTVWDASIVMAKYLEKVGQGSSALAAGHGAWSGAATLHRTPL